MNLNDYIKSIADPLIKQAAQRFLQQLKQNQNSANQPFLGQMSSDGYTVTTPNGQKFNAVHFGTPASTDSAVQVNKDDAIILQESLLGDSEDPSGGLGYIAFQYGNHNYVRQIGKNIAVNSELAQTIISQIEGQTASWSAEQSSFLTDLNQPALDPDTNASYIPPPKAYYPAWDAYRISGFTVDSLDCLPFIIPENLLDPRISPNDYLVLFTGDGKHLMFGGSFLARKSDPNFPEADGHVHTQFVVYNNFQLKYDETMDYPTIISSDWNPGDQTKSDGSPVVQSVDLNLSFDGYSRAPQQADQGQGLGAADPRLKNLYLWGPGQVFPDSGSQFAPEVGGSFNFSGSVDQNALDMTDVCFQYGLSIGIVLTGTHQAVWKPDPMTALQFNQIGFAFNVDAKGNPRLDLVSSALNTAVYYLATNYVSENMKYIHDQVGPVYLEVHSTCNFTTIQNAVFDWYDYATDWIGNYKSIVLGQFQVVLLNPKEDWHPPANNVDFPYDYNGVQWLDVQGDSPVSPLPDINKGVYGGVSYQHTDGVHSTDGSGFGEFGPSYDPSLPVTALGGLVLFTANQGPDWCIAAANAGGGQGGDPGGCIPFYTGSGNYHFFDNTVTTFTDPPGTGGFCTDPCFHCQTNNFFVCYGTIDFFPLYATGGITLLQYETDICTIQDVNYIDTDGEIQPHPIIQAYALKGQGDQRTLIRAFRSVAGNPALMYTFSAGTVAGAGGQPTDQLDQALANLDLLDKVLQNIDALADGQFVPGLSGTGSGTTPVTNIYWELVCPYGTAPQLINPDGKTKPDGVAFSDKWYFPKGSFPYPFQLIKGIDSDLFLVYVTGFYQNSDGSLLKDNLGHTLIFEFLYEYNFTLATDGTTTIFRPTGKSAKGRCPTSAITSSSVVAGGANGQPSSANPDLSLNSHSSGEVPSYSPADNIVSSLNAPGDGSFVVQDYVIKKKIPKSKLPGAGS